MKLTSCSTRDTRCVIVKLHDQTHYYNRYNIFVHFDDINGVIRMRKSKDKTIQCKKKQP